MMEINKAKQGTFPSTSSCFYFYPERSTNKTTELTIDLSFSIIVLPFPD